MKTKPVSVTVFQWLRDNLGKGSLGALTQTDSKALAAAVQIIDLMGYNMNGQLIAAFTSCVLQMQPGSREFAFHAIAHVLDWDDRFKIWDATGLPPITRRMRCKFEPAFA